MLNSIKFRLQRYPFVHSVYHMGKFWFSRAYRQRSRKIKSLVNNIRSLDNNFTAIPLGIGKKGTAVIFGWSHFDYIFSETTIRKSIELAGFNLVIIGEPTYEARYTYEVFGIRKVVSFSEFQPLPDMAEALAITNRLADSTALLDYKFDGVAVGKFVSATYMRKTRQGNIDLNSDGARTKIAEGISRSIAAVRGAKELIRQLGPSLFVMVDHGYTPCGEVFDVCVDDGIDIMTWNVAHRNNTLMLKRYSQTNRMTHPSSLSASSWRKLKDIKWSKERRFEVEKELTNCYNAGEWYSEVGTQFGKRLLERVEVLRSLSLDESKKTAVIYSHIFWDATFFWGDDLFDNYEEWFLETVSAACRNDRVNWLIKIHPANIVKDKRDGRIGKSSEILALERSIKKLPSHVQVILPETITSTWSLLSATDYCLTVRGTVGIEAALLGKVVLTAGTGRYDRHGFTHDYDNRQSYLEALGSIDTLGLPGENSQELASRFASGVFLHRPIRTDSFQMSYDQDEFATLRTKLGVGTFKELKEARDISTIARWLNSNQEDLLQVNRSLK